MERRRFFLQTAAVLATGFSAQSLAEAAQPTGHTVCGFDKRRKANICTVRVTGQLQYVPAQKRGTDISSNWLACLQMVFKFYGYSVPAQNILRDVYGGNVPKAPWQDLAALGKPIADEKGKHINVVTEKLSVRATDAAELLAENQPLIIGAFGHPVLLTAMSYTGDRLGGMTIVDATVLDPSPGKGTRIVSSPEWVNVTFITRVGVRKGKG